MPSTKLAVNKPPMRLHARTMVRDGTHVFMGSQSLRRAELESRREIGLICRDARIVSRVAKVFEEDWSISDAAAAKDREDDATPAVKVAKKVAKAVAKELPPVAPMIKVVIRELAGETGGVDLTSEEMEETVRHAVKAAVKEAVQNAVESSQEHKEEPADEELAEMPGKAS